MVTASVFKLASRFMAQVTSVLEPVATKRLPSLLSAAAIVEAEGEILLVERSDGYGICLPGGIVLWGETPEEAVRREAYEETGLWVTPRNLVGGFTSQDPRLSCVCMAYVCDWSDGVLKRSAEGVPVWVPLTQLPDKLAFGTEDILAAYLQSC